MRHWALFFIFLVLCFGSLVAEEKVAVSYTPSSLSPDWWDHITSKESTPEEQLKELMKQVELQLEETPIEERTALQPIVNRIATNSTNYQKVLKQEPEALPPAKPISESYNLDEILSINREIRQDESIRKTDLEELKQKKARLNTAQNQIERLQSSYKSLQSRTIEKLKAGLELIAFRLSYETAKVQASNLQKAIEIENDITKRLRQEQTAALQRIEVTPQQLEQARIALEQAQREWEAKQESREVKESENISAFAFWHQDEDSKLRSEAKNNEYIYASIEEAIAEVRYLFAQAKYNLIQLNLNRREADLAAIANDYRKSEARLGKIIENSRDWQKHFQISLERVETSQQPTPLQQKSTEVMQQAVLLLQKLDVEINDVRFFNTILSNELAIAQGGLFKWIAQAMEFIKHTFYNVSESATNVLFVIGKTPITLMGIVRFILIIAATFWFSHLSKLAIQKVATRKRGLRRSVRYQLERLFHYLILALGFIIALSSIGFDFSSFLLIAGALGVGLGFGLQAIFNNFISGIIILFESQLKVGDYIEMDTGVRGEVKEINFRSTYIKTNDGIAIIVPNSELINTRVVNWTMKENYRRVRIPFSVAYGSDKDLVTKVVQEAASKVSLTLTRDNIPKPKVGMINLGADGIEFELVVWVDERATKRAFSTKSTYLWAIHDALVKNDIEIPFPQRTLHFPPDEDKSQ